MEHQEQVRSGPQQVTNLGHHHFPRSSPQGCIVFPLCAHGCTLTHASSTLITLADNTTVVWLMEMPCRRQVAHGWLLPGRQLCSEDLVDEGLCTGQTLLDPQLSRRHFRMGEKNITQTHTKRVGSGAVSSCSFFYWLSSSPFKIKFIITVLS